MVNEFRDFCDIAAYFVVCNQLSVATMMAIAQLMNCVSNPIISCMSYVNQIKSTKGIRNTILPLLLKKTRHNLFLCYTKAKELKKCVN